MVELQHLWHDFGYRHIPNIGPLFVLQTVSGALSGLLILLVRRVWVGVLGIGFVLSTLVGFLVSVEHGTLGFRESWSAPDAHLPCIVELATMVILVMATALSFRARRASSPL